VVAPPQCKRGRPLNHRHSAQDCLCAPESVSVVVKVREKVPGPELLPKSLNGPGILMSIDRRTGRLEVPGLLSMTHPPDTLAFVGRGVPAGGAERDASTPDKFGGQ
jgi:hypothetical protein